MSQQLFEALLSDYGVDQQQIAGRWNEILACYSEPWRHYHTLEHLGFVGAQLAAVREQTADWNTLLFTLFYHDAVYDPQAGDNEEQSAQLAVRRMREVHLPEALIQRVEAQILATKSHALSADNDTNLFTDADLSILGATRGSYAQYSRDVRKEYSVYPDELYNPGRTKVLQHFLGMQRIFKTPHFAELYEEKARENLQWETEQLVSRD